MDIKQPGQQLNFYFDVSVEFFLYTYFIVYFVY